MKELPENIEDIRFVYNQSRYYIHQTLRFAMNGIDYTFEAPNKPDLILPEVKLPTPRRILWK